MGALAVLFVAAAGWLLFEARAVRSDLITAQGEAGELRATLFRQGRLSPEVVSRIRKHTAAARRATSEPVWVVAAHLPFTGPLFRTVQGLSVAADQMATGVLPDFVRLHRLVQSGQMMRDGGAIDLQRLTVAGSVLGEIEQKLSGVLAGVRHLPAPTGLGRVDTARLQVIDQVGRMTDSVSQVGTAARLLVPVLGQSGPRSYFFAFQTNAEARGTGGLVGVFGIVTADHGHIWLHDLSSDDVLPQSPAPVVDLGPAFERRYGNDASAQYLINSNMSAHFPYAARIWVGLWRQHTGQRLDGAIATDPVGLAHLLGAIGPVRLPDGEEVTAANAVELTESTAYARYPGYADREARKRFLVQVAQATITALLHGHHQPVALLEALRESADDGRLRVWSDNGAVQSALERTSLAGSVPEEPGPFAYLVVNNAAASKLDYYLDRSVTYELGPCQGGTRPSTVRIKLANTAPASDLPAYVTFRADDPTHTHLPGSTRTWVSLYASVGAQFTSASLDGRPLLMSPDVERGHLVVSSPVELGPGQTRELDIHLQEPASDRRPVVPVQPLVRGQITQVVTTPCPDAAE